MRRALLLPWLLVSCASPPSPEPAVPADELASDLARYVRALESKNAAVSLDALDYLPYFGEAAVPFLIRELASPSANGRALAAAVLGRLRDPRAVAALAAHVEDPGLVEFNVLSDDGERLHPAHDTKPLNVGQQARLALEAIRGAPRTAGAPGDPLPDGAGLLRGMRICLDPGHGGDMDRQGYKRGPTGLSETETNLRVARYLRDFLVRAEAAVFMTRDSDRDVPLADRPRLAERERCDLFLSIHHNWSPRFEAHAATAWVHRGADHHAPSTELARCVQEEVNRAIGASDTGGVIADTTMFQEGFAVLRLRPPQMPACLAEMTYVSNVAMERRLRDPEFNRAEARGLFLGIVRFAGRR